MRDEARNTDRYGNGWQSAPLRGQTVAFVSAGNLSREEELEQEPSRGPEEEPIVTDTIETSRNNQDVQQPHGQEVTQPEQVVTSAAGEESEADSFVELVADDSSRQRKTSISSASSDEIIFIGREKTPSKSRSISPGLKGEDPLKLHCTQPAVQEHTKTNPQNVQVDVAKQHPLLLKSKTGRHGRRGRAKRAIRPVKLQSQLDEDEEAIMQDYIENLAMSDHSDDAAQEAPKGEWRRTEHFRFYDGAGEENQKVQTKATAPIKTKDEEDWESTDLQDFDEMSTTEDEVAEIENVIRKRQRPSGTQYLVHPKGATTSDAKWIFKTKLTSEAALNLIAVHEQELILKNIEPSSEDDIDDDASSEDDDEGLEDLINQLESEDEENERVLKHTEKMTDEEIARALQKQEQLGMGGDDVMLFDGHDEGNFGREAEFVASSSFSPGSRLRSGRKYRRSAEEFPSASLFADVLDQDPYGGFDVMDFDRPSLKPKKKGRKGDFPFDIPDDPELADKMQATWAKDREKKAARKAQKLEARLAAGAAVPSNPDDVKGAIRAFLVDEYRENLPLPPMAPHVRAAVHRLAKCLSLKSDSKGKGDNRHPVLTKTPFTTHYTASTIGEIDALINQRRFLLGNGPYRSSARVLRSGNPPPRNGRGGGGAMFGATYMEGEIVGASAPEIGAENKGRAMLEKMGWSSGMGIGAVGNEGSIDVIQHKVKKSKAGLG